ncbi:hypothetical protein KIL84_013647 [Mauremys mutica]|uniref:Uncharacterized protein n=1 Tax=Mauremys mutica TaxID=74926 RepID=A0A9D3WVV3_9SAUR|nr:hypothetical protein KIL84_013647 [Mauremys mutica]
MVTHLSIAHNQISAPLIISHTCLVFCAPGDRKRFNSGASNWTLRKVTRHGLTLRQWVMSRCYNCSMGNKSHQPISFSEMKQGRNNSEVVLGIQTYGAVSPEQPMKSLTIPS